MYEPEKILVQNAGIDPGVAASKLKKKQQVSTMKKWRSVKIFQINQKRKQKFLQ